MTSTNEYEFYAFAPETWSSMLEAIRGSKESIDLEQYIFCIDKIGLEFIELLRQKNRDGVKVRILLDTVGSWGFYNSTVVNDLTKEGIQIRFFNPISPWRIHTFTSWIFRDHRKNLIIDKRIAFVGGLGIGSHMENWRDTTVRVTGLGALEIDNSFSEYWNITKNRSLRERIRKIKANIRTRYFVTSAPYFKKRFLYYTLIEAIRNAKSSIMITTPYFVPDIRLSRVLRLATKRNVRVTIILPKEIDVPIVQKASENIYSHMLKRGIKIYEYPENFHHGKVVIVDEDWATTGSLNMDNLSLRYNFEANIVSTEKNFVKPLVEQFGKDLQKSKEIVYSDWKNRPFTNKVREFLAGLVSEFL